MSSGSTGSHSALSMKMDSDMYITCPYDKNHRVLPIRLSVHLVRCARNQPDNKMLRCPFNNDHRISNSDLQNHLRECPNRADFNRFVQPDALPPEEPRAAAVELVESSENWDDEIPADSYKPNAQPKSGILRKLEGAPRKQRREFRESERRRFREMNETE